MGVTGIFGDGEDPSGEAVSVTVEGEPVATVR